MSPHPRCAYRSSAAGYNAVHENDDLFDGDDPGARPLADRVRPSSLGGYIGQDHLLGEGKPLRRAIESGRLHSMIFWGRPAPVRPRWRVLRRLWAMRSRRCRRCWRRQDIRAAVDKARHHALPRVDAVPCCSSTRCIASTRASRTPFCRTSRMARCCLSVPPPKTLVRANNALLSRARVYVLKSLPADALKTLLQRALSDREHGLGERQLEVSDEALDLLADAADGDARRRSTCWRSPPIWRSLM